MLRIPGLLTSPFSYLLWDTRFMVIDDLCKDRADNGLGPNFVHWWRRRVASLVKTVQKTTAGVFDILEAACLCGTRTEARQAVRRCSINLTLDGIAKSQKS